MDAKFAVALALVFAVGLVGCSGDVPASATIAPTPEPTSTLPPTAVPTEVPIAIPTELPSPTPTEAPLYVGLSAAEVEALRAQCLQDNPNSICLPLPFAPANDVKISVVSESWENYWEITVTDGEGGPRFLSLEIPAGTELFSPLDGDVWIQGVLDGYGYNRLLGPGRTIEGVSSILFGWGPFVVYGSAAYNGNVPSVELTLVKRKDCTAGRYQEGSILKEPDLIVHGGSRQVTIGEPIAQTAMSMCLQIAVIEPVNISVAIPPGEGGGAFGGRYPIGRTDLSDLLTTPAGSIVFVLP